MLDQLRVELTNGTNRTRASGNLTQRGRQQAFCVAVAGQLHSPQ